MRLIKRYDNLREKIEKKRNSENIGFRVLILLKDFTWFSVFEKLKKRKRKKELLKKIEIYKSKKNRINNKILYLYDFDDWAIHNVGKLWLEKIKGYNVIFRKADDIKENELKKYGIVWFGYLDLLMTFDLIDKINGEIIVSVHDPKEIFPEIKNWKNWKMFFSIKWWFFSKKINERINILKKLDNIITASKEMKNVLEGYGLNVKLINTNSQLSIREEKRLDNRVKLISIFKEYPRKNIGLMNQIKKYCLKNNIKFFMKNDTQILSIKNYEKLLDQYSVYICTSFQEGGPIPAMDAMKRGLVVLSTPVGQMTEMTKNGFNGFICKNYNDFISKIELLKRNKEKFLEMRRNSIENIKKRSNKKIKNKTKRFLDSLTEYNEDSKKKSISLVFLTYNNLYKTKKSLESFLKILERKDVLEMLILDNNSNEKIKEFLKELSKKNKKIKVIFSKENLGVARGRKVLFEKSKGDYIFSIDSDAILIDEKFINKAKKIISNKRIGICGPVGSFFVSKNLKNQIDIFKDKYEGEVDFISGCCQIFRKDILEDVSIDEKFSPFWYEDVDFCYQIKDLGLSVYRFDDENYFFHEWSGNGNQFLKEKDEKRKIVVQKWKYKKPLLLDKKIKFNFKKNNFSIQRIYLLIDKQIGKVGQIIQKSSPQIYNKLSKTKKLIRF